ncbi:hypothetical protein GIB67_010613 [Kingdonia uniflora]|uniref:Uncharacterized protein n=1 Tax=Kingdonia uniflora TaxID=39325 RepID=A0A7J7M825_9MAGN|nr:hypothetical protein GIB67_010613 [Kingdonia uniflora]
MKSDKEVNKQVDEENQTLEGRAKKGTSNTKNYASRCTSLKLHKMFATLPEEEKGVLRATCFAPLLLIDLIATMSTLVVEIFDRYLGIRVSPIANELLFVNPEHMMNFKMRRCSSIKFAKNYTILSLPEQGEKHLGERYQIEAPVIGVVPAIGVPAVVTPAIGSSSSATKIGAVVVRVCSQLEKHGKMLLKLDDHGKMLKRILMSLVGDSTLPLGDTLLLGQYQFYTPEKAMK